MDWARQSLSATYNTRSSVIAKYTEGWINKNEMLIYQMTEHIIISAKQMTGFCKKCNTGCNTNATIFGHQIFCSNIKIYTRRYSIEVIPIEDNFSIISFVDGLRPLLQLVVGLVTKLNSWNCI